MWNWLTEYMRRRRERKQEAIARRNLEQYNTFYGRDQGYTVSRRVESEPRDVPVSYSDSGINPMTMVAAAMLLSDNHRHSDNPHNKGDMGLMSDPGPGTGGSPPADTPSYSSPDPSPSSSDTSYSSSDSGSSSFSSDSGSSSFSSDSGSSF